MRKYFWAAAAAVAVYEVVAIANRPDGDTISEMTWAGAKKRPLVPFLAGVVAGHLFWQKAE